MALPRSILFACGWNTVRSPMAAAILKQAGPAGLYVASAGVRRGEPDPFADAVMREIGLEIAAHEPVTIEDLADTNFDLVVTLSPEAHHAALELTRTCAFEVEYWPVLDPTAMQGSREQILAAYRALRDDLVRRIGGRLAA